MKKTKLLCAVLALMLTLLCACGADAVKDSSPSATPAGESPNVDGRVHVSTVDELLAAIAPDTAVYLEEGSYDLTAASDYGKDGGTYYHWRDVYEGYELVITGVSNFSITAGLNDKKEPATEIVTVPRMANVLTFESCDDIGIFGVVIGHTEEPGVCSGGVLRLLNAEDVTVEYCELFGCGTLGLEAVGCEEVTVQNSVIRHCTVGAVSVQQSRAVAIKLCEIRDCGDYRLFSFDSSGDCAVLNCSIIENNAQSLAECVNSENINLLGCTVKDNTFTGTVFSGDSYGKPIIVAGCEFVHNSLSRWFGAVAEGEEFMNPVGLDGKALSEKDLDAMVCEYIEWAPPAEDSSTAESASGQVNVSTVDELLAAIAPNTTIYLEDGTYDLSTASDYGAYGSKYYRWETTYDGPQLIISGVQGLAIVGSDAAKVTVTAAPRYANVLSFMGCNDLYLSKLTVGHTQEPGECSGGVVFLSDCERSMIQDCSLFGCGTVGVWALESDELHVIDTEIYDCSVGGVFLDDCDDAVFTGCSIHDMDAGTYEYSIGNSENVVVDGVKKA